MYSENNNNKKINKNNNNQATASTTATTTITIATTTITIAITTTAITTTMNITFKLFQMSVLEVNNIGSFKTCLSLGRSVLKGQAPHIIKKEIHQPDGRSCPIE